MSSPEGRKGSLSVIQNRQGETVGVRIRTPQAFGPKWLREVTKRQMATKGRQISLKVAGQVMLLPQEAVSKAGNLPHKKRREAIRFIAATMYEAEEVIIHTSEIKQGSQSGRKMDSIPSTFTIRKPTVQELIQITQNWQENNGKWITLLYKEGGEKHCVTLTSKEQAEILVNTAKLDAFARISVEVTVHKST